MSKKKKAFTLTELLVSLAIIGTIAVFAIPPLMSDIHTKVYLNLVKNMSVTIEQLASDQMLNKRSHNLSDTDFGSASTLLTSHHFAVVNSGEGFLTESYKNFKNEELENIDISGDSVLLKNGVVLVYKPSDDSALAGTFVMDANGNDGPNVAGKDLFMFDVTKKGKLTSSMDDAEGLYDTCADGNPKACYGYLLNNGWKYPN